MLKITRSSGETIVIEKDADEWAINGEKSRADIQWISENSFHLLLNDQSYTVELPVNRVSEGFILITINGISEQVKVQDEHQLLLEKLGMGASMQTKIAEIKAPMPGLVLQVNVKDGDLVRKGDTLLVLEAMKMENSIKSPVDAMVKKLLVKEKTAVEKNQVLMVIE